MLKSMRKHAKYFYVLFFMVIVSFIFWGVGGVDNESPTTPVASIDGEQISLNEYWRTYDRMEDLMRDIYSARFDDQMRAELKQKVLDDLINERLLYKAALRAGLTVTDKELSDSIASDPNFLRDGVFSREIYLRTLELNRLKPDVFESLKRRDLLVEKVARLIQSPVELTPAELEGMGGDKIVSMILKDSIKNEKKERALKSYIDGLKNQMKVKKNPELIS